MKRIFDIVISVLSIIILSPVYLILVTLIKLETRGPALFEQERVGKGEKPFRMYKFRSMVMHNFTPEELGPVKHHHTFVTHIGYLMRRTKLDEIPQFINVLRGEMSIVGPRPCLFVSIKKMTPLERRRFEFLPGITGWAEVNGNVALSWQEERMLDVWYVDHHRFSLDLYIIGRTLLTIFFGSIKNTKALLSANQYQQDLQVAEIKK